FLSVISAPGVQPGEIASIALQSIRGETFFDLNVGEELAHEIALVRTFIHYGRLRSGSRLGLVLVGQLLHAFSRMMTKILVSMEVFQVNLPRLGKTRVRLRNRECVGINLDHLIEQRKYLLHLLL